MKLRIPFRKVVMSWDVTTSSYLPKEYPISYRDLIDLKIFVDDLQVDVEADPDDVSSVLVDIPIPNLEDSAKVEIRAVYKEHNGADFNDDFNLDFNNYASIFTDFNNDFNNDFGGLTLPDFYFYKNTFEVYGYDLGNTSTNHNNPNFNIYFVVDFSSSFNCDFNQDFNYHPKAYADGIVIRKPFTNEVYFYKNTSDKANTSWYKDGELITTMKNGSLCEEGAFNLTSRKDLYCNSIITTEGCGCDGATYTEQRILNFIDEREIKVERNKKWGLEFNMSVLSDCKINNECKFIKDSQSRALMHIDYSIDKYIQNDKEIYPYQRDEIIYYLYDQAGFLLDMQKHEILNFSYYNAFTNDFKFNIPTIGDYVVKGEIRSYNHFGELIRLCEEVESFKGELWAQISEKTCDTIEIDNCSFTEGYVIVRKLVYNDKTNTYNFSEVYDQFPLPRLRKTSFTPIEDGIYEFTISNEGYEDVVLVRSYHCNLLNCIKQIQDQFICNNICKDYKQEDFAILTALYSLSTMYFAYWDKIYTNSKMYTLFPTKYLTDVYKAFDILNQLKEYCYECETLLPDCGCK